jgi:hypothetical protein
LCACVVSLQLADMFANAVLDHVDFYLSRVVNMTTSKVGQCHPMSRVYNATVVAVCNQILDPFVSRDTRLILWFCLQFALSERYQLVLEASTRNAHGSGRNFASTCTRQNIQ